jgi:nucleotide-binding universal stress UspA family protein
VPYERVWLATDLNEEAVGPWSHALRICATSGADLRVLHVHRGPEITWSNLPMPRTLLIRWGFLPEDATLEDYAALGMRVRLDALAADHPLGILEAMADVQAPDLLVVGRRPPSPLRRLLDGSVSEALARQTSHPTLVVPDGARPFVSATTGAVRLTRVLIPLGEVGALTALTAAGALADGLQAPNVEFVFVHVGPHSEIPRSDLPDHPGWTYRTVNFHDGAVVGRVLEAATREEVDLIAMATHGHDSLSDTLWGSHTERVLRDAQVPLLVTPYRP